MKNAAQKPNQRILKIVVLFFVIMFLLQMTPLVGTESSIPNNKTGTRQIGATPPGTPGPGPPPQDLRATAGDGYVNLTWNGPVSEGGSSITHYRIYRTYNDQTTSFSTLGNVLSYTDYGVENGQTYTYQVSANLEGELSTEVYVTPTSSENGNDSNNTSILLFIILILVVVLVFVLILFIRHTKSNP